jgi:hypothetical protein
MVALRERLMTFSVGCWGVGTYTQYTKATSVFTICKWLRGHRLLHLLLRPPDQLLSSCPFESKRVFPPEVRLHFLRHQNAIPFGTLRRRSRRRICVSTWHNLIHHIVLPSFLMPTSMENACWQQS